MTGFAEQFLPLLCDESVRGKLRIDAFQQFQLKSSQLLSFAFHEDSGDLCRPAADFEFFMQGQRHVVFSADWNCDQYQLLQQLS